MKTNPTKTREQKLAECEQLSEVLTTFKILALFIIAWALGFG